MNDGEREAEPFERVGSFKRVTHAVARAEHLSLPLTARLRRSWQLYLDFQGRVDAAPEHEDDPSPFYERAKSLGLYRG